MTVLPGSLDNLYYNGILDHIPYEAYEYGAVSPYGGMINPYSGLKQSITGTGYLNAAKGGLLYDKYNSRDSFVYGNMSGNGAATGGNYSIIRSNYGGKIKKKNKYDISDIKNLTFMGMVGFIDSIREAGAKTKDAVLNAPSSSIWKGLAGLALIIAIPILMIKGRKKYPKEVIEAAEQINKSSFWSKFNPKNWFKK